MIHVTNRLHRHRQAVQAVSSHLQLYFIFHCLIVLAFTGSHAGCHVFSRVATHSGKHEKLRDLKVIWGKLGENVFLTVVLPCVM